MSIDRMALVVTNAGTLGEDNYCRGVFVDSKLWRERLLSDAGGAWESSEIVVLDQPNKNEFLQQVEYLDQYDYSLFVFSGHGWYSPRNACTMIEIQPDVSVPSTLLRGGNCRVSVLDCCRVVYKDLLEARSEQSVKMARAATRRRSNRARCRELFDKQITSCGRSFIEINSCDIDEKAGDDEKFGGRYTSSLHAEITAWCESQEQLPVGSSASINSVPSAHELAAAYTRQRSGNRQNPKIEKDRSGPYPPFSVFSE